MFLNPVAILHSQKLNLSSSHILQKAWFWNLTHFSTCWCFLKCDCGYFDFLNSAFDIGYNFCLCTSNLSFSLQHQLKPKLIILTKFNLLYSRLKQKWCKIYLQNSFLCKPQCFIKTSSGNKFGTMVLTDWKPMPCFQNFNVHTNYLGSS